MLNRFPVVTAISLLLGGTAGPLVAQGLPNHLTNRVRPPETSVRAAEDVGIGVERQIAAPQAAALPVGPLRLVRCTPIRSVPYTISTPGQYCLVKNLTTDITSGTAILIDADHVTLDLAGFSLTRPASADPVVADGIASTVRNAVTVRNGTVDGFLRGVSLAGQEAQGALVEKMRVLNSFYEGIRVEARGATIRANQVVGVVSTPEVVAASGLNGVAVGMGIYGSNNRVLDNSISGFYGVSGPPESESYGINLNACDDCIVAGNKISNATHRTSYGIQGGWSTGTVIEDNQIINVGVGVTAYTPEGILYTDNVAFGCDTPYGLGVDGGGNR